MENLHEINEIPCNIFVHCTVLEGKKKKELQKKKYLLLAWISGSKCFKPEIHGRLVQLQVTSKLYIHLEKETDCKQSMPFACNYKGINKVRE